MAKKQPDTTPEADPADQPTEKITQREAVKRAIAAGKGMPADGIAYIKETFGLSMANNAFSTLKSQLKQESSKAPKRATRAAVTPEANGTGHEVGNGVAAKNPADLARGIKQLIADFGADAVKDMAVVLSE